MKRLLQQLDLIEAIVDTASPSQIENEPQDVASRYELYASSYDPIDRVKALRERLIAEIDKGKPVNGYLSADYGYGKTATLVYLWHECERNQIVAVPPFKFKELGNLIVATYGWLKASLERVQPELIPEIETLYYKYSLKSQEEQAAEIARKYKVSENKALKIVQELKTDTTNTDTVLKFWQESIPILRKAGMKGLAIFADESQEFLRTEEGSSARIQILSDLVKGMRGLGSTPIALILSMPTTPTESAIEEQAGDIIHRMKEQKVSLQLADAYNYDFPGKLWDSLCDKFLDDKSEGNQLAHPATIKSLGQLCERRDLSNGPRAVIEVFKRLVDFVRTNKRPYTPLDLIEDYLEGRVQFYGAQQHRINNTLHTLEQLTSIQKHPKGRDVIKLLAIFPSGVSEAIAEKFGLLESLKELVADDNLYGIHIIQPTECSFALVSLSKPNTPTVVDKILNRFRQQWFGEWDNARKEEMATAIFKSEILFLLFPVSKAGQKANWNWRYKNEWKQDSFGFYNFLSGVPERYNNEFPNRFLVISIGNEKSELMKFTPPEESHLDWRFYLSYDREARSTAQRLTAIAGTGQVDFHIQLGRSFEREYPTVFGLLSKLIPPEHCSACTLLNLSYYIQDWLLKNPEVSKADLSRLEHHRQECHQYAIRLLFPAIEPQTWIVEGLKGINGAGTKLIESAFYQKCKDLFPEYKSFYNNLRPTSLKYKSALEKVPLAVRRGRQVYQVPKAEFEKLFEASGSGLPSVLAIFKQYGLISEYKIAGKKEENSQVKFSEHLLEDFIKQQLQARGRVQENETQRGWQDVQALSYLDLWEEVKQLGYLQEEFEEALEWLQWRRYIKWERQRKIVSQALVEPDFDDMKGQLNELHSQVSLWLEAFDDKLLYEIKQSIDEVKITIMSAANSPGKNCDVAQLNLFIQPLPELGKQKSLSELYLDQIQRILQANLEKIEEFCRDKCSALQKELGEIKLKLENVTGDLITSKVGQPILGNSGLETCLNDYRKNLERQVEQLDRDCKNLASLIKVDETDIMALHYQKEHCNQFLQAEESARRLQPLVAGLEEWRIILIRAEALRKTLVNEPERNQRYEDEFIDRVVEYFEVHKMESFGKHELLQRPLAEIEEQINGERRSRREEFEQLLIRYEALLGRIVPQISELNTLCRFDNEDWQGSHETLRKICLAKLQDWCSRQSFEWEQLEQNLCFLVYERKQYVTKLLTQVRDLKMNLAAQITELPNSITNLEVLEEKIKQLEILAIKAWELRKEFIGLQSYKDENLKEEERQLLNVLSSLSNGLTVSQLRQHISENQDIWKLVKTLHQKGHLEITLYRRDRH